MNKVTQMLGSMLPDDVDAALIVSGENKRYFTGFPSDDGYLLITRDEAFFLTDSRYEEAASNQAEGCTVICYKKPADAFKKLVSECGIIRKIMLEGSGFTVNHAESTEEIFRECGAECEKSARLDSLIGKLRIIKTSDEIDKIIKAQRITELALKDTLKLVKEGVSERDLALELEYKMRKLGADGVSFDLIVITGSKTSMPHGVPGNEKVKPGDMITFDIGALWQGYHSDMTRTYAFGYADEKQKRVYEIARTAQQLGLDAVRSGVTCSSVDKAARDYIASAGFGDRFGHSTGHGVGLEIHEAPTVSSLSETKLESGMVITVEPGIYLPGEFGVRIEDTVAVTSDGCINLATLPKELIVL